MVDKVIRLAKVAGEEILKCYNDDEIFVDIKQDNSPVTNADILSHEMLSKGLKDILDLPLMSEESIISYEQRKHWDTFWLIDPLDGTKDFIAKNGEFTINIALIKKDKPILGVVYVPCLKNVYFAQKGKGAFKNHQKIFNHSKRKELIGADSNFYSSRSTQSFFDRYNIKDVHKIGSSIKICKLAEGKIDVYPRLNGTKEWDTAASHIIANEAGCKLVDVITKKELLYNKKDYKNNFFIASRNDLYFEDIQ